MLGRPLDIMSIVKAPQRPRKSWEDAIGQHQCKAVVVVEQVLFAFSSVRSTRALGQFSYVGAPGVFNEDSLGV